MSTEKWNNYGTTIGRAVCKPASAFANQHGNLQISTAICKSARRFAHQHAALQISTAICKLARRFADQHGVLQISNSVCLRGNRICTLAPAGRRFQLCNPLCRPPITFATHQRDKYACGVANGEDSTLLKETA